MTTEQIKSKLNELFNLSAEIKRSVQDEEIAHSCDEITHHAYVISRTLDDEDYPEVRLDRIETQLQAISVNVELLIEVVRGRLH